MEQFIPHNTKLLLPIVAERNGSVYNHQAKDGTYKCTLLKTKGQRLRVSVQHKQSNMAKTIQYVPKDSKINVQLPADAPKHVIGRFFNWDPIIDGAAGLGAGFAPEMLPFILAGKEALKHWLHKKSEKKHKKGHKEGNFERAFEGGESNRSMNPIQDLVKHMNAMTLSDQSRKRKASEIDVGALAAQRHHTLHTVNGNLHVRSFDGKSIPLNENEAWIAQHSAHLNSSPRYKPDEVVVQDNLRQIVKQKFNLINLSRPLIRMVQWLLRRSRILQKSILSPRFVLRRFQFFKEIWVRKLKCHLSQSLKLKTTPL
jgi:hypothetical protein